jgi:hypothetical protein
MNERPPFWTGVAAGGTSVLTRAASAWTYWMHYSRRALPFRLKAKYGLTDEREVGTSSKHLTRYRAAAHKIGNKEVQRP